MRNQIVDGISLSLILCLNMISRIVLFPIKATETATEIYWWSFQHKKQNMKFF